MSKTLADIAVEIQDERAEIKQLEKFKLLVINGDNYVALVNPFDTMHRGEYIHRLKNIEKSMKNFMVKKIEERIKNAEKRIGNLEKEIVKGTVSDIMEDSTTPEKEKRNFFGRVIK